MTAETGHVAGLLAQVVEALSDSRALRHKQRKLLAKFLRLRAAGSLGGPGSPHVFGDCYMYHQPHVVSGMCGPSWSVRPLAGVCPRVLG